MARQKGELSIFVDESGSFDSLVVPSRFYLVTCVFHNQDESIRQQLGDLENQLTVLGFQNAYLHAGPLIRREEAFRQMDLVQRRKLFSRMVAFTRKCPISYRVFSVDKKYYSSPESIRQNLLEQIGSFLSSDGKWMEDFQKVKIYYDNGQQQVKSILHEAFSFLPVEFPVSVTAEKYRLFQSADLICTVELVNLKLKLGVELTKSESAFFPSIRDFRKTVAKPLGQLRR